MDEFDDFDTQIQPEELFDEPTMWEDIMDDNPIESDYNPSEEDRYYEEFFKEGENFEPDHEDDY